MILTILSVKFSHELHDSSYIQMWKKDPISLHCSWTHSGKIRNLEDFQSRHIIQSLLVVITSSNASRAWFCVLEHTLFHSIDSCIELADETLLSPADLHSNKMWLWKIMNFFILSSDLSLFVPSLPPALLQNNKILFWVACIPEAGINRKTFHFYDSSFSPAQNSDLFCSFRRAVGQSWDSNMLSVKYILPTWLGWFSGQATWW